MKRILKYWLSLRWWKWDLNMHSSKMKIQNELKTRFKVALLTLDGWTGLISQIVIDDTDKHWRSQSLNEVKKSRSNSEVEIIAIASYSSQRQLRSGFLLLVRWSVSRLLSCFSGKPRTGFFRNLAWTFSTIRLRNAHGRLSGKNLDHSIISDVRPKTAIFQLWADFDGKPR